MLSTQTDLKMFKINLSPVYPLHKAQYLWNCHCSSITSRLVAIATHHTTEKQQQTTTNTRKQTKLILIHRHHYVC